MRSAVRWTTLLLYVAGCACAEVSAPAATTRTESASRDKRASTTDRWLTLLSEFNRETTDDDSSNEGWFPPPEPVSLSKGTGDGRPKMPLPVLVVPVPVPQKSSLQEWDESISKQNEGSGFNYRGDRRSPMSLWRPTIVNAHRQDEAELSPHRLVPEPHHYTKDQVPQFPPILSSQYLVEMFCAQQSDAKDQPPVLIPSSGVSDLDDNDDDQHDSQNIQLLPFVLKRVLRQSASEGPQPDNDDSSFSVIARGEPERPRFDRSLKLRGKLTVFRAGYTEQYTVWWDSSSGASRVDFHNGATSTYRMVRTDGRVQGVEVRVDRTSEREVRVCSVTAPRHVGLTDRALPALPDLQLFSFADHVETSKGRAEVWRHTISGRNGELGAARGEVLVFRHELLLLRSADNYTAMPLRYSVEADSSVLGANCDNYVHHYTQVIPKQHDPEMFKIDLDDACEVVKQTDELSRVEPLREFTAPHRDLRYDAAIQRFKIKYERRYVDEAEEAVRKNVLVQTTRFVHSGNRQSATFELGVNFLGDRLRVERAVLTGAEPGLDRYPAEDFPHSHEQLAALRDRLPREFDWRPRGAVTPVKNQGVSCASSWAFAVTGAVEGALFVRTRRLVPLSEQCLVDCAHPYGGHGCKSTWPPNAYEYIRERGIPAEEEYTPYLEKVATCMEARVHPVTRVSAHVNVTKFSVDALKVAIRRHAPTVVIVDATTDSFANYKKGILYDDRCAKLKKRNHAVLAVGWSEHRNEPYFVVKNSWGSAWGDDGYIRLHGPSNTCGLLTMPSYPHLERADVMRFLPTLPLNPDVSLSTVYDRRALDEFH